MQGPSWLLDNHVLFIPPPSRWTFSPAHLRSVNWLWNLDGVWP